jgi:hypothetical protein
MIFTYTIFIIFMILFKWAIKNAAINYETRPLVLLLYRKLHGLDDYYYFLKNNCIDFVGPM